MNFSLPKSIGQTKSPNFYQIPLKVAAKFLQKRQDPARAPELRKPWPQVRPWQGGLFATFCEKDFPTPSEIGILHYGGLAFAFFVCHQSRQKKELKTAFLLPLLGAAPLRLWPWPPLWRFGGRGRGLRLAPKARGGQHRELMQCEPIGSQAVLARPLVLLRDAARKKHLRRKTEGTRVFFFFFHGQKGDVQKRNLDRFDDMDDSGNNDDADSVLI